MEIALDPAMATYSDGLGVLAGDTLREAADRELTMSAGTLLHRQGYFRQKLDAKGWQTEEPYPWDIPAHVKELAASIAVKIEERNVQGRAWQFDVLGVSGGRVPVYLLDTDLEVSLD